jgi:hypothetical protein
MVIGARRTGLSVSRTAMLVRFFTRFPVCIKNGPPPKGHPANLTQLLEALESTWSSIPVERFRHLVESTWASIPVERFRHLVESTLASIPVERFRQLVESTWASIPVERFRHLVESTWTSIPVEML